jgi:4-hydroxymandelate oxidase
VMAGTHRQQAGVSSLEEHSRSHFDPSLSWPDLAWLREFSPLPVVVKGVLTGSDAARCAALGVAAVVVSNHGGRQLDGAIATMEALPEVVDAVAGRCPVLVDGGVRTGTDVLRALALGADAVLVGRPVLWGLACEGTAGAAAVLRMLSQELADAMVLTGRPRLSDLDPSLVLKRCGSGLGE